MIYTNHGTNCLPSGGTIPYFDHLAFTRKVNGFDKSALIKKSDSSFRLFGQFTPIDVFWSEYFRTLTISGSLPWYSQGHNLSFDLLQMESVIHELSCKIDVDLFSAGVKSFEVSKIISVEREPIDYLTNHFELRGFNRILDRTSLYYNRYTRKGRKDLTLKFYDATSNAIAKKMSYQPSDHLIKAELKAHNPAKLFDQTLTIYDLIEDHSIIQKAYSEMKTHYAKIRKGLIVKLPENPSTEELILAALVQSNPDPITAIEQLIKGCSMDRKMRYKRRAATKSKLAAISIADTALTLKL